MTTTPSSGAGQSFCGNCGAQVMPNDTACASCGQPVNTRRAEAPPPFAESQSGPAPDDYVPYCRTGGEPLRWEDAHTCRSCGLTPLCSKHFEEVIGLCSDCSAAVRARAGYEDRASRVGGGQSGEAAVEYMGFWVRLAARIIDQIILLVVIVFFARFGALGFLIEFMVIFAYYVAFTAWLGQTPGKMLMGIQVVNAYGRIPTLQEVFMREVLGKIASTLPLLLGYAWVLWDPHKRAWHDHIGKTYVVRKPRGNG